jgi:hypothetical protein
MDPDKASSGDKSLRKRGKRILGAPFNAMGTLLGTKSKEARKSLKAPAGLHGADGTWSSGGPGSSKIPSIEPEASAKPHQDGDQRSAEGAARSAAAGFLTKLPDPSWIDIEMMGHWLKKCDMEHGSECRKPFGLDPSGLGKPQWLIDVRRKCLASAEPEHRYACLSYVCKCLLWPLSRNNVIFLLAARIEQGQCLLFEIRRGRRQYFKDQKGQSQEST